MTDAQPTPESTMADTKVLLVDDNTTNLQVLRDALDGLGAKLLVAKSGAGALAIVAKAHPDLILLDIMMPEMDGYEFMRTYRKEAATPIVLLTARLEESDKVLGLELGADDYVTKPFGMRELTARIRAVLRRGGQDSRADEVLRVSDITLDRGDHAVLAGERPVRLTPSEFDLLAALMAAPGRVFTRAALLEQLPGISFEGAERTIDVHIRNLRTKLEPEPRRPRYIETVFGVGYRFALDRSAMDGGR